MNSPLEAMRRHLDRGVAALQDVIEENASLEGLLVIEKLLDNSCIPFIRTAMLTNIALTVIVFVKWPIDAGMATGLILAILTLFAGLVAALINIFCWTGAIWQLAWFKLWESAEWFQPASYVRSFPVELDGLILMLGFLPTVIFYFVGFLLSVVFLGHV